jgi:hypothetical protein
MPKPAVRQSDDTLEAHQILKPYLKPRMNTRPLKICSTPRDWTIMLPTALCHTDADTEEKQEAFVKMRLVTKGWGALAPHKAR